MNPQLTPSAGMWFSIRAAAHRQYGIGVPEPGANSRAIICGFFVRSWQAQLWAGREDHRKMGRPWSGTPILTVLPTLIGVREADFKTAYQESDMTKQSPGAIAPVSFDFNSVPVRTVSDDKGNPWFLANDVCTVLGYVNPRKTIGDHCREGGVTKRDTPTDSGVQAMTFIDEGNLYRLIIKSRKPEAEPFERWVMDEVLPAIRKTGSYAKPQYALKDLRSKKALPGGLTLEQQDAIKAMVKARAEEAPEAKRGIVTVKLWSALKSKFGCPYKLIPPEQFTEALSLVARVALDGDTHTALPVVLAQDTHHLAGQRLLVCIADDGTSYQARAIPSDAYVLDVVRFLKALNAGDIYLGKVETHLLMDTVDHFNRSIRFRMADILRGVVSQ